MQLYEDLYAYPWTQMTANNCNSFAAASAGPLLVDPGHAAFYDHVAAGLRSDGLAEPKVVVLSHCHPDHLEAALKLQRDGARLAMHPAEAEYMSGEGRALASALGLSFPDVTIDFYLQEGEFTSGEETFQVLHTPGHSPGHICLYWPRLKALFAGDLVFAQGVGRVDFPGGDGEQLKQSIGRVAAMDLEWLLPGHGPVLKGAQAIAENFKLIEQMYFSML